MIILSKYYYHTNKLKKYSTLGVCKGSNYRLYMKTDDGMELEYTEQKC